MSSPADILIGLNAAQYYLLRFGCPILMLLGTIGCILNLIAFIQKNLRKNSCSIYFIAYNIGSLIYIYAAPFYITLNVGFNIDASIQNLVLCRLRLYITVLFNCLCSFYLILASVDRVLITSANARTRRRSTLRMAYTYVLSGTIFWGLFHSHELILINIIQILPNVFLCYFDQGIYRTLLSCYLLTKELVTLTSLAVCGLWTIKNIRASARRIGVAAVASESRPGATNNTHSTSSKDRQLALMLLMDILIYGLFYSTYAVFFLYQQVTQNDVKSPVQTQIEGVVRNLAQFAATFPPSTSFYTNFIASKTFRHEVKRALSCHRIFNIHRT